MISCIGSKLFLQLEELVRQKIVRDVAAAGGTPGWDRREGMCTCHPIGQPDWKSGQSILGSVALGAAPLGRERARNGSVRKQALEGEPGDVAATGWKEEFKGLGDCATPGQCGRA